MGINIKELSNEELVVLINETNLDEYWMELLSRTEKSIHKTYHKHVNSYYKDTMSEDIYTILKTGWVKAVKKYNPAKATAGFVPFSMKLMEQEYVNFAKRINKEKDGKSVKAELINSVNTSDIAQKPNTDSSINGCVVNIQVDTSDDYNELETKDLLDNKFKMLQKYYPTSHKIIIDSIYNHKTQNEIAQELGIRQTSVSRYIKQAKDFLRQITTHEEYYSCINNNR